MEHLMQTRSLTLPLRQAVSFGPFSVEFAAMMPAEKSSPRRAQLAILEYSEENGSHYLQLPDAQVWPIQFLAQGDAREVGREFSLKVIELSQRELKLEITSSKRFGIKKGYVPD